eukprot:scaffold17561_cov71-Phaeocystis_antarctica.AAC.1
MRPCFHPLDIWAKAAAAAQIDGGVYTKPRRFGHGVDEAGEGRLACEPKVASLGHVGGRHAPWRHAAEEARHARRLEACAVDELIRLQVQLGRGYEQPPARLQPAAATATMASATAATAATAKHTAARHWRVEHHSGSVRLRVALQRQHQLVSIHNPRRGRDEAAHAAQLRLELCHLVRLEQAQRLVVTVDTIGLRALAQRLESRQLARIRGHNQLAAPAVSDPVLLAEAVQLAAPLHARARLEASGLVVDAGVDDPAVARRRDGADGARGLKDQHLPARSSERARDRETNHAGSDDNALNARHCSVNFPSAVLVELLSSFCTLHPVSDGSQEDGESAPHAAISAWLTASHPNSEVKVTPRCLRTSAHREAGRDAARAPVARKRQPHRRERHADRAR